jgi:hypothetical protein
MLLFPLIIVPFIINAGGARRLLDHDQLFSLGQQWIVNRVCPRRPGDCRGDQGNQASAAASAEETRAIAAAHACVSDRRFPALRG